MWNRALKVVVFGIVAGMLLLGAAVAYAQVAAGSAGPGPRASGYARLLTTSTAATSSTVTAGRTLTRPTDMVPMGMVDGARARCVSLVGMATGSAANTFAVEVWAVNPGVTGAPGSGSGLVDDWDQQLLGTATFTLGTSVGVGTVILPGEKIAHQVSWSAAAYGTAVVSAYAGVAGTVYSPGSNGQAVLFLPECGNAFGLKIVPYNVTTTTCNVVVQTGV